MALAELAKQSTLETCHADKKNEALQIEGPH